MSSSRPFFQLFLLAPPLSSFPPPSSSPVGRFPLSNDILVYTLSSFMISFFSSPSPFFFPHSTQHAPLPPPSALRRPNHPPQPRLQPVQCHSGFLLLCPQLHLLLPPLVAPQLLHIASLSRAASAVYALFFNRNYLSSADCLFCFSAVTTKTRTYGCSNSARAIFDGCFFRYEATPLFDQTMLPDNVAIWSNNIDNAADFGADVRSLMMDLSLVTLKVAGLFRDDDKRGSLRGSAVCGDCEREQVHGVPGGGAQQHEGVPDGRAVDVGCFVRYSDVNFFGNYSTVDLAALLASSDRIS